MTPTDRAAIRARLEKVKALEHASLDAVLRGDNLTAQQYERQRREAKAVYDAHAPTDLAALLADVERKDEVISAQNDVRDSFLIMLEAERARADALAQQVETLRAALDGVQSTVRFGCWCDESHAREVYGHQPKCEAARAAVGAQP